MSSLSFSEKSQFEKLFGMDSGYVLDFSNRTFGEFFLDSVGIDIWIGKYNYNSGSKANRLRAFWNTESNPKVGKLLDEMLNYWKSQKLNGDTTSIEQKCYEECISTVDKLLSRKSKSVEIVTEDQFLDREFKNISLEKLNLDSVVINRPVAK